MRHQTIALFGGSGFIGSHLVARLTRAGRATRVLTRHRERQRHLLVNPSCRLVQGDVADPATLRAVLDGCDAAINLVGILNQNGGQRFEALHADLPASIADACLASGVRRLLHMSALHASPQGPSKYLQTKALGEDRVHARARDGLAVTSFRPSVIFGPGDSFVNRFAGIVRMTPLVLPLACAESRFAPAYVGDVVRAFDQSLDDESTFGKRYDLCGPEDLTLADVVRRVAGWMGLKRTVLPLPDFAARLQGALLERLPGQIFTTDNYLSLQVDSVCRGAPAYDGTFADLGIAPQPMSAVVPSYVDGGDKYGYDDLRERAGR